MRSTKKLFQIKKHTILVLIDGMGNNLINILLWILKSMMYTFMHILVLILEWLHIIKKVKKQEFEKEFAKDFKNKMYLFEMKEKN